MDLSEGKRYARLIPGSRMEKIIMEEREREAEALEREQANELARAAEEQESGLHSAERGEETNQSVKEEAESHAANPFDRVEMMERVLRSLPGPREEIESAVRRKYTREEIEALIQQVWERRQRELEEAMASFQTEADGMRSIMFQLLNDTLVPEQQADLLHELDYFVTTAHNAEDFARVRLRKAMIEIVLSARRCVQLTVVCISLVLGADGWINADDAIHSKPGSQGSGRRLGDARVCSEVRGGEPASRAGGRRDADATPQRRGVGPRG